MTGRTHDLFAFTSLTVVVGLQLVPQMTVGTMLISLGTAFVSGLVPDLDESTSTLWRRLPAGSGRFFSSILTPVFGSHRFISHSLVGLWLYGQLLKLLLQFTQSFLKVNVTIVWWAGILGFLSHLIADTLTREGVPLAWPIPWKFGFPPLSFLRMKTGGFLEKSIVFPGLVLLNSYWIYLKYPIFVDFFRKLL